MKNRLTVLGLAAVGATLIAVPSLRAQAGQSTGQSGYGISEMAVDDRYVYVLSGGTILRIEKRTGANAGTLSVGTGANWNPSGTLPRTDGGATGTGSTTAGSTATGTTATGSTATGSTATGSTATGSTATGSTATGSTATTG